MIEKEVKVLEINKEEIIKKLKDLGAKEVFNGRIITVYLDFPDFSLKNSKKALRLRKEEKNCFLDLKKSLEKIKRIKVNKELRVSVSDFDKTLEILKEISLEEKLRIEKNRTSFLLNNVRIDIDEIEGIPTFLEIEGEPKEMERIIHDLGLKNNKVVSFNTFQLLSYYSK